MKIKCQKCQSIFEADKKQSKLLNHAISNGGKLIFIECPICYKGSCIDPFDLLDEKQKINQTSEIIECPICKDGIISYVDDGTERFWGCGECGNVWFSKEIHTGKNNNN